MRRGRGAIPVAIVLALSGCTGEIGDPPTGPSEPALAPMRRLTRFEYDNAVRDLLGDTTHPARSFAPDTEVLGFDNQTAGASVGRVQVEQYLAAAEALAATAVADLDRLLACPFRGDEDHCARVFIDRFARRAYRRPLTDAERGRLLALYAADPAANDYPTRIGLVVQAVLQSPRFLYRVESGVPTAGDAAVLALDGYEIAARLSFLVWGSIPDDALLDAAEAGELATGQQVATQARRMLADPRAREGVRHFHEQWLGLGGLDALEKDAASFPAYNAELRPEWKEETLSFLDDAVFGGRGLRHVLTSPTTMVNGHLARFYGVDEPAGDGFQRVSLDPARYAGILSQPGVLAVHSKTNASSPVRRGKFVRERLLCQLMGSPPPDAPLGDASATSGMTTRERSDAHRADPACAGCHELMDPIGFGFEHFDGVGRWRDDEDGRSVDASGELSGTLDVDGTFDGVVELGRALADSHQVSNCVVRQWFTYGFGRPDVADDRGTIAELRAAFRGSDEDVRELIVAITRTNAFRFRVAPE